MEDKGSFKDRLLNTFGSKLKSSQWCKRNDYSIDSIGSNSRQLVISYAIVAYRASLTPLIVQQSHDQNLEVASRATSRCIPCMESGDIEYSSQSSLARQKGYSLIQNCTTLHSRIYIVYVWFPGSVYTCQHPASRYRPMKDGLTRWPVISGLISQLASSTGCNKMIVTGIGKTKQW